ncbi:MAG: FecR family protein [Deltaproteobacteria bacterium]|jgi:ferric-dicitrate binding protein FerR (iron transport regulator)|nr:FecR family protein [Deltaproteobacteria bacterium]
MNRSMKAACWFLLLTAWFWSPAVSHAYDEAAMQVEMEGNEAGVTFLEGKATLRPEDETHSVHLELNARLRNGDRVTTGPDARIELTFADKSIIRFDEDTTFELIDVSYSRESNKRDINIKMIMGRIWAKVSKIAGQKGGFDLHAVNAVAGVRGTTYRMNILEDSSTVVKVYSGEVTVQKPVKGPDRVEASHPVQGPHPVSGPGKISMEEWTYIVRAMQQIVVRPDGTAEKPVVFSVEADSNKWVRWNQERDAKSR